VTDHRKQRRLPTSSGLLNDEDVGDINYSSEFAKMLDEAKYSEIKANMKEQMVRNGRT
jgi:hypothetical protein